MTDKPYEAAKVLIGEEALRKLTKAHIAVRWERDTAESRCQTCRYYDTVTWFPAGRNNPPVSYCSAESCTCAPNGFDEWEAR